MEMGPLLPKLSQKI